MVDMREKVKAHLVARMQARRPAKRRLNQQRWKAVAPAILVGAADDAALRAGDMTSRHRFTGLSGRRRWTQRERRDGCGGK